MDPLLSTDVGRQSSKLETKEDESLVVLQISDYIVAVWYSNTKNIGARACRCLITAAQPLERYGACLRLELYAGWIGQNPAHCVQDIRCKQVRRGGHA